MMTLAAVLAGSMIAASSPLQNTVTLQRIDLTGLPEVVLYLTVTDAKGDSVLGLTDREMSVVVDGTAEKIASLRSALTGGEHLAVALLFDRSGSMASALARAREAAVGFLKRLSSDDRLAVISFDDKVRVDAPFSGDQAALESAIAGISMGADTALYDAIHTALGLLQGTGTKRLAILILSDGKDTKSALKREAVLAEAKAAGVPLFTLGLGDGVNSPELGLLASETGGSYEKAARPEDLLELYQRIAERLKNQYVVSFRASSGADSLWHKLKVRVDDPRGASESVPREYIASQGPGVSRDMVSGIERKAEEKGLLGAGGLGALIGLAAGMLLFLLVRLLRPEAPLRPLLAAGMVILAGILGGIVGLVLKAVGG
jgi:VWFA-related protein